MNNQTQSSERMFLPAWGAGKGWHDPKISFTSGDRISSKAPK